MATKPLTIIVCTRNRASILAECLHSLSKQSVAASEYNVLVVDNASTDATKSIIEQYTNAHENFEYAFEGKVGLSRARNTGWSLTETVWVGYMDDDAKAPEAFVERALYLISAYDFDCFGGTYYAWYKYGKPEWLPADFGNKPILRSAVGCLEEGEHLSGGIFFCKRDWLEQLNGFDTCLGMTDELGYGEEDDLQQRLRAAGGTIGYDPGFYIEHCVLPHKLKLGWHLRSAYRHGLSTQLYNGRKTLPELVYWVFRTLAIGVLKRFPLSIKGLLIDKDTYWQNIVLEIIQLPLQYAGKVMGALKKKITSR